MIALIDSEIAPKSRKNVVSGIGGKDMSHWGGVRQCLNQLQGWSDRATRSPRPRWPLAPFLMCPASGVRWGKPKPCYNWFSWTNIIIFALLIGIILSFTVKSEQFERIRQKILMDEFMGETPSYAPSAPQLPSNKLKDIDFETALL